MDLHVEQHGAGAPLVLAHGFAGSARNFRPQIRALRERYRVVVYDAPGHARSAAPEDADAYRREAFLAAFGQRLDALAGERAVGGGLSMGAATALLTALEQPQKLRGLVLASVPGGRGHAGAISGRADAFAAAIERDGLDAAGARYVWGPESGLDAAAGRWVRQGFLEHAPHALAAILRGFLSELPTPDELGERLRACTLPALVVAGADDPASLEPSRRLAELLPSARFVVIPDAGHVVNLARPEAFNAALLEWLEDLPPDA